MQKFILILTVPYLISCSAGTNTIDDSTSAATNIRVEEKVIESTIQDEDNINSDSPETVDDTITTNDEINQTEETPTNDKISNNEQTLVETIIDSEDELIVSNAAQFHQYAEFNELLVSNVSSKGVVNYNGIKSNSATLDKISKSFESNYPKSSWTKNQKLAYWINAYNFYTLKLVSSNYPVSSITKITAKPWDKKFISLGGETISLNDIEHKKIRAVFNEPRIHFALNCASESCPVLLNKAYTASNLNYLLDKQTRQFLKDPTKNDFSNASKIRISQLFDWYKSDFTKTGTLQDFFNKYLDQQTSASSIEYLEYSWELND